MNRIACEIVVVVLFGVLVVSSRRVLGRVMNEYNGPIMRFSDAPAGSSCVLVCRERDGVHLPSCPIVALDAQVRELTAHTGIYVAAVQETLETIGRILRDERRR